MIPLDKNDASFIRWASPPDRVVADWPSLIYPNPVSTEIYTDLTGSNEQIENLRIVSINGQVLIQSGNTQFINVSAQTEGAYILQIELAGGK